jgi:hypothetical protein
MPAAGTSVRFRSTNSATTAYRSSSLISVFRLLTIAVPCLAGLACTTRDAEQRQFIQTAESTLQEAQKCRSSVASKEEYRALAIHLPLVEINHATLTQMADTSLASHADYSAISDWQMDIRACRDRVLGLIQDVDPRYVPIVLAEWNEDDEVLVQLARRKLAWGDAVMRLRSNRAKMLTRVADQLSKTTREQNQNQEAALNRRASFVNALVGTIP